MTDHQTQPEVSDARLRRMIDGDWLVRRARVLRLFIPIIYFAVGMAFMAADADRVMSHPPEPSAPTYYGLTVLGMLIVAFIVFAYPRNGAGVFALAMAGIQIAIAVKPDLIEGTMTETAQAFALIQTVALAAGAVFTALGRRRVALLTSANATI